MRNALQMAFVYDVMCLDYAGSYDRNWEICEGYSLYKSPTNDHAGMYNSTSYKDLMLSE